MEKDVLSPSSSNIFSHDISGMSDFPLRNPGHRRAQSEIPSLPVDLNLDGDLGIVGPADEMEDDFLAMYLDMDKLGGESSEAAVVGAGNGGAYSSSSSSDLRNENPRVRHQHSQSMDGSTEFLGANSEGPTSLAEAKKAMSAAKLAELALVDPKKAKRTIRLFVHIDQELCCKRQRDTTALTAENNELKLRLQTVEQQVHLQDALNNALREEVQRLKMATGQMMPNGPMMNFGQPSFGGNQQFYHQNQNKTMQPLPATHQQQLQIRQPQYQHQQQQQPPGDFRLRATLSQHGQRESIAGSGNANGVIR
ncbi:uncharacterized protein A4U43_C10F13950 [Asparagus officinalis]|uniref:BZIP domain-containing protein n=1 Tax=Asparagus officinalis TaxID=4686 RepID=A0A5P1E782_ASPOF|nr:uncharacterized protein A4U43_C10F13950 [Asparagus officinalis]